VPVSNEPTQLNGSVPDAADAASPANSRRGLGGLQRLLTRMQRQGLLIILVLLVLVMWRLTPYFMTTSNLLNVGSEVGALGIMAMTQTALIISGGFDVSVGSALAMAGVTIGILVEHGWNIWVATLAAVVVGALVGALNGFIVVKLHINALITTLGTLSIFSGLAYIVTSGQTLVVNDNAFAFLGTGQIAGIPFPLILFAVVFALAIFIERMTRFGRTYYAIGGSLEAARLAGLRVSLTSFILYVVSGLSAGIAGVLITSQLSASSPQVGANYNLSVVTAVILGGASLAGGRGSALGTLLAVFILGVLQDGFALLQLSAFVQTMALGIALIIAVLLDQTAQSFERRRLGTATAT
jgi:ribose transport system permease protein